MFVVFQGETGGYVTVPYDDSIPATSGQAYAVAQDRVTYRFDGILQSGNLLIAKSGICNLPPGQYVFLPQLVDADNLLYFLSPDELRLIGVPNF